MPRNTRQHPRYESEEEDTQQASDGEEPGNETIFFADPRQPPPTSTAAAGASTTTSTERVRIAVLEAILQSQRTQQEINRALLETLRALLRHDPSGDYGTPTTAAAMQRSSFAPAAAADPPGNLTKCTARFNGKARNAEKPETFLDAVEVYKECARTHTTAAAMQRSSFAPAAAADPPGNFTKCTARFNGKARDAEKPETFLDAVELYKECTRTPTTATAMQRSSFAPAAVAAPPGNLTKCTARFNEKSHDADKPEEIFDFVKSYFLTNPEPTHSRYSVGAALMQGENRLKDPNIRKILKDLESKDPIRRRPWPDKGQLSFMSKRNNSPYKRNKIIKTTTYEVDSISDGTSIGKYHASLLTPFVGHVQAPVKDKRNVGGHERILSQTRGRQVRDRGGGYSKEARYECVTVARQPGVIIMIKGLGAWRMRNKGL